MVSVALLVFSIIPVAVLGGLMINSYRSGFMLRAAILGATLFHELVFIVFPICYSVFTDFALEERMLISVGPEDLLVVMIGEAIFVALFGVGMKLGRQKVVQVRQAASLSSSRERVFLFLLVGAGLLIYVSHIASPPTTLQTLVAHSEGRYYDTTLGMLFAWFRGFFQFPSLVASSLVLVDSRTEKYPGVLRLMGLGSLVLVSLLGLSMGVRGRVIWVASLLAIVGFVKRRKAPIYVGLVLLVGILPFFVFLGGAYRSLYFSQVERGATSGDLLNSLAEVVGNAIRGGNTYSLENERFIFESAERAQGPRNSVILYWLYRNGLSAGFRPLEGAIVTPIPRIIWPGKRQAGSFDTTTYGAAVYLVRRLGYGSPAYNMGPYLASAHAYWEGGWIWLVFAGLITGLFWNLLLRWCAQSGSAISIVIALTFSFAVLANGLPTALQPLYDFVRLFWVAVLPTLMLSKLTDMISLRKEGLSEPRVQSTKRAGLGFKVNSQEM